MGGGEWPVSLCFSLLPLLLCMLNNFIFSTYKFSCSLFMLFSSPVWWWEGNTHLYGLVTYGQLSTTWFLHTWVRQKGNRDLSTWIFVLKGTSKGYGVQIPCNEQGCLQLDQVAQNPVQWMFPRMGHLPAFWAAWFWILCFRILRGKESICFYFQCWNF